MAASTKAQLREAIKREGRIKSQANLDTLVDDIVTDILRDYCNLTRFYELLVEGATITLVAAQQVYDLPADFGHLNAVRYGRGPATTPGSTTFRVVDVQPDSVRQTWSSGWPRFYRLVAGNKLSFWPYGQIAAEDQLVIDYYVDPLSLYVDDTDLFPIPRLESAVKKDAIARIQRFVSATAEAQMTEEDAGASFNASNASD